MTDQWEKDLTCAGACAQCDAELNVKDQRILSVYTVVPENPYGIIIPLLMKTQRGGLRESVVANQGCRQKRPSQAIADEIHNRF